MMIVMLTPLARFGSDCIRQWLSPTNIPNRNNCPMCRTELFEIDHSGHTDEDEETDEGVDEDERLQEYIDQVAPELRSLLETGSFANLNAALDYMQNIMRGDAPTPSGMLYSRQVYAVFDFYKDLHTLWPRDSFPAEAGVNAMRRKLLWLMGQLYVRFGGHIDHMSMPIPWRENGPRMCDILDSENMHGMIECGLIQFVSAEEHYNATRRRYNHLD